MIYKSFERLNSDDEVESVLQNVFTLLREAGVSGRMAGDGIGYAFQAGSHYRSSPNKENQVYLYVFRLVNLDTGLYVAYCYSDDSEKAAFREAITFVERAGLSLNSVRLEMHYSSRKNLRELGDGSRRSCHRRRISLHLDRSGATC